MDEYQGTYHFEELTAEEKRRVITALSRGLLSEEEKRELAEACKHSRLTDDERKQLTRAFTLSRMTDEERAALVERRRKQKQVAQTTGSVPNVAPKDRTVVKAGIGTDPETVQMPRVTSHTGDIPNTDKSSSDTVQVHVKKKDSAPEATRVLDASEIGVTETHPSGRKTRAEMRQLERSRKQREREEREEEAGSGEHTALTSLLKAVVYIIAVLIISVFASYAIIVAANDIFAFVKSDEVVSIVIEEDMTVEEVADLLYENRVIAYPSVYELFIKFKKYSTNYLPGEYEISPSMNYKTLNRAFTHIETTRDQVVVTIPEGYTIDQMIDLFVSYGLGTREAFVSVINTYPFEDYRFISELPELDAERKYRLEGYLFPDTYYFFTDNKDEADDISSEYAVVYKLLENFDKKITEAYYERADALGMTMDEVVTLASMLQAEGNTQNDFVNISSVFHNRLERPRDFPLLQSDATLQYILDKRKVALTAEDLAIDSKYNSYKYKGLPPSAICNPGLDAIDCALYPADTEYYYFLADSYGNTYFSKTLAEHEALKKEHIG